MSPRNSSTATCSPTAVDTGVKKRKASGEGDDDTNREPCKMHKPNPPNNTDINKNHDNKKGHSDDRSVFSDWCWPERRFFRYRRQQHNRIETKAS
ncbi:hypothetical protein BZA77DRAFT_360375 [Pyronema omphalodes]|nr:hypothetical protein BZA77DRAFT_361592 [Pyronema omphalodes]KAI5811794.1 hypothetical protein BZA77DRAFT_360371 [Pyronema omphalodes]KAI5811797.1 hypothetical protein BZA77DRAFT_360375 [Pyronema omphalodes]